MKIQTLLAKRIRKAGGLRRLAAETGLDAGYISRVMNGHRQPGPEFLERLGLQESRREYEPTNGR